MSFTSYDDYSLSYDATIDKTIIAFRRTTATPTRAYLGIITPGSTSTTTDLSL